MWTKEGEELVAEETFREAQTDAAFPGSMCVMVRRLGKIANETNDPEFSNKRKWKKDGWTTKTLEAVSIKAGFDLTADITNSEVT